MHIIIYILQILIYVVDVAHTAISMRALIHSFEFVLNHDIYIHSIYNDEKNIMKFIEIIFILRCTQM